MNVFRSCLSIGRQQAFALRNRGVGWYHCSGVSVNAMNIRHMGIEAFIEQVPDDGQLSIQTGRAWTAAELRRKSFEDLHKLWYVLYKERNLLLSIREKYRMAERSASQSQLNRYANVKRSMAALKLVLAERRKLKQLPKDLLNDSALG